LNKLESKSGFVNILGIPNSGKSTLINKLVGKKVSIVSHKVQTTRFCVRGICTFTYDDFSKSQIILIDTPGIFSAKRRFDKAMVSAAWSELNHSDKVIFIHDVTKSIEANSLDIIHEIFKIKKDVILVLNKIDLLPKDKLLKKITEVKNLYDFEKVFLVSARNGNGCDKLIEYLAMSMPTHPLMYDDNTISDLPLSILASEITREKLFKNLNKELPYNLMVETEKWDVKDDKSINIQQTIYVNKNSHKPIILGKSGQNIKRIGILARKDLEKLLDNNVHLFLFVKFKKNWMEDPSKYSILGLNYNA
jgi:GTP-binding protein Era